MVVVQVAPEQDQECKALLKELWGVEAELARRGRVEFARGDREIYPLNRGLVERGFKVEAIFSRRRTLEEYFVQLTGESQDVY
jgi:hypothetical protein